MSKLVLEQYPDETLEHYYHRLAKVADQRLVRLEKLAESGQEGFENVKKWAYSNAMADIQAFDGENARRFNTAPPVDERKMLSKINAMKRFIEKPTSAKSSILKGYKRKADTFNKKYGTDFSWENLGNAYESATMKKLQSKYGSEVIARALANVNNKKKELQALEEEKARILKIEDDPIVTKASLDIYENYADLLDWEDEE